MISEKIIIVFVFLFGLSIGSFLNCYIYRLKIGESLKGNSFCPSCKHKLSVFDLIPLLSFLFLKGKCRYCDKKISFQYPIVEFFTGFLFVGTFLSFGTFVSFQSILLLILVLISFSLLIVIFVYDLKHYIIPNKVIYPTIGVVSLYIFLTGLFANNLSIIANHLIAGVLSFIFFFSIFFFSKGRGIGFGDVRYSFLMGLLLGYPDILVGLFLSFFIGAIIGVTLIAFKIKERKDMIPFGPFLVTGTFVAFFWGEIIINWYLDLFL